MVTKRQHYIPRLHLKHFIGEQPRGQVWTFDKDTGLTRSATPENTAVETHFYSAEGDDGAVDTRLEDFLAVTEDKAAPIYNKLITGKFPVSDQQRADFSTFVALMYARTPAVRRDAAEIIARGIQIMNYAYGINDEAFDALVKRIEKDKSEPMHSDAKDTFRQWLKDPSHYTIKLRKERTFMALGAADRLAPILFDMNWSLVRPRHGFFISSDNPVVRWVDPSTHHPIYGDHGFLNKTAEVTFPLTPKILLMMSWRENLPKQSELERDPVWSMNKMRAAHADRYLYAHISKKDIRRLATDFKNSRPRMTTAGFGPDKFTKVEIPRRWSAGT